MTEACNYLLVYEYIITADVGTDMWAGIKRIAATQAGKANASDTAGDSSDEESPPSSRMTCRSLMQSPAVNCASRKANRTLLLGGRRDGQICVFNMETGEVDFEIEVRFFF